MIFHKDFPIVDKTKHNMNTFLNHKHLKYALILLSLIGAYHTVQELYGFAIHTYYKTEIEFSNFLNFSLKIFQNIIFLFLLINIFVKMSPLYIGIIMPISYYEQHYNWFYNLHYFFLNSNFYNFFSAEPYNISPEYPRIWFFVLILIVLLSVTLFKKLRTFDRIFLLLAGVSCLSTSILFHTMIISEINFYKNTVEELHIKANKLANTPNDLMMFCKTNQYSCLSYEIKETEDFLNDKRIPNYITPYMPKIKELVASNEEFHFFATATDFNAPNRIIGQKPFVIMKNSNFITLSIDNYRYKLLLARNQTIFATLGFASHITWFFGALFLIWFHKRKNAKNRMFLR